MNKPLDIYEILTVLYLGPDEEAMVKQMSLQIDVTEDPRVAYQKGWIDCTLAQNHLLNELFPLIHGVFYETNAKKIKDNQKKLKQKIDELW